MIFFALLIFKPSSKREYASYTAKFEVIAIIDEVSNWEAANLAEKIKMKILSTNLCELQCFTK